MLLSCKFLVVTLSHMSIISRIKIRTMREMDLKNLFKPLCF